MTWAAHAMLALQSTDVDATMKVGSVAYMVCEGCQEGVTLSRDLYGTQLRDSGSVLLVEPVRPWPIKRRRDSYTLSFSAGVGATPDFSDRRHRSVAAPVAE